MLARRLPGPTPVRPLWWEKAGIWAPGRPVPISPSAAGAQRAREHPPYMLTDQELLALEDAQRAYIERRQQPMLALPAPICRSRTSSPRHPYSAQELRDRAAQRRYDDYEAKAADRLGRELMEEVAPVNKTKKTHSPPRQR